MQPHKSTDFELMLVCPSENILQVSCSRRTFASDRRFERQSVPTMIKSCLSMHAKSFWLLTSTKVRDEKVLTTVTASPARRGALCSVAATKPLVVVVILMMARSKGPLNTYHISASCQPVRPSAVVALILRPCCNGRLFSLQQQEG